MSHRLITALLGGALVLSACLGGADDADDAEPAPDQTTSADRSLSLVAWESVPRDEVSDGGTLRLAADALPDNFNPAHVDGRLTGAERVLAPTTGSAVRLTDDGSWETDPRYADAVEILEGDGFAVRVQLHPDAVWQDGTPIRARDMVAYARAMRGGNGFDSADTEGFAAIDEVRPRNDGLAYVVRFSERRSDWPQYVYPRLPSGASSKAKRFNTAFVDRAVPSNGPFVVTEIDDRAGTIVAERNPRWWGEKPALDQVVWRVAAPEVQVAAFAADELDAFTVPQGSNPGSVDDARMQQAFGTTWSHLTMNGGRSPLSDAGVRTAVAQAIDRDAIAQAEADRVPGAEPVTAGSTVLVPGQPGYADTVAEQVGYDPEAALETLRKAGYAIVNEQGERRAKRDGKRLRLTLPVPSDTPGAETRAELIADDLAEIGIEVRRPTVPLGSFFTDVVEPLAFDLVTFTWEGSAFPVQAAEQRFRPFDSPLNYTGMDGNGQRRQWRQASQALTSQERGQAVRALDEALLGSPRILPLAVQPQVMAVREGLVNFGAATFRTPDFTAVGYRTG